MCSSVNEDLISSKAGFFPEKSNRPEVSVISLLAGYGLEFHIVDLFVSGIEDSSFIKRAIRRYLTRVILYTGASCRGRIVWEANCLTLLICYFILNHWIARVYIINTAVLTCYRRFHCKAISVSLRV